MILVIDATNLNSGGGLTHITNIIKFDKTIEFGFQKLMIFHGSKKSICRFLKKTFYGEHVGKLLN